MFLIPWGAFAIIGTTEADYDGDFDRVHADANDVAYIVAAVNHAFPGVQLQKGDVISTYAGLRPLVVQSGKSAHKTSREHQIWTSESGLVTIAGGKLTTYRSMGQELVNRVAKRLREEFDVAPVHPSATARTMLVEGDSPPPIQWKEIGAPIESKDVCDDWQAPTARRFSDDVIVHLIRTHGPEYTRVLEIAERDARFAERITEGLPYIWAEVQYALEQEMAMTVVDVLARRTHILLESRENGIQGASQVAAWLGESLDWDKSAIENNLRAYEEQVGLTLKFK